MSANVVGTLSVPFSRAKIDAGGTIVDDELRASIDALAVKLIRAVNARGAS